ncbi:hypothetical protein DdX_06079 [Ditylenchus destructor]|uniref:Uncharacterized protein n=1 Tax=Ditylenchus destructor TaxID=166010 RepID=A0AAD4N6Y3_9BILA|nr:hypothetical protein DdX_06079 [Ditylenchus destructor]
MPKRHPGTRHNSSSKRPLHSRTFQTRVPQIESSSKKVEKTQSSRLGTPKVNEDDVQLFHRHVVHRNNSQTIMLDGCGYDIYVVVYIKNRYMLKMIRFAKFGTPQCRSWIICHNIMENESSRKTNFHLGNVVITTVKKITNLSPFTVNAQAAVSNAPRRAPRIIHRQ